MLLPRRLYPVCILLLSFAGCRPVIAQSGLLNGLISDNLTGLGVSNALVLNYSTRENVYSDNNGVFKLGSVAAIPWCLLR